MPIQHRMRLWFALDLHDLHYKKNVPPLRAIFYSVMQDKQDPWCIQADQVISCFQVFGPRKAPVKRRIISLAVAYIISLKQEMTCLCWLPTPQVWFRLQPHVNDSVHSKMHNSTRAGDAGLGNHRPNDLGSSYKICPWYINLGIQPHWMKIVIQSALIAGSRDCPLI